MSGCFITIEGGDGCGKTTQSGRIARALRELGLTVIETREPGGPIGVDGRAEVAILAELYALFLDPANKFSAYERLLLINVARGYHCRGVIGPALSRDSWVICDRFIDSTYAYQGADGIGSDLIEFLHGMIEPRLEPDLTFILDLDPRVGLARHGVSEGDVFHERTVSYHEAVRERFQARGRAAADRCVMIDGGLPCDEVTGLLLRELGDRFGAAGRGLGDSSPSGGLS